MSNYECGKCNAPLTTGWVACPACGDKFDVPVPEYVEPVQFEAVEPSGQPEIQPEPPATSGWAMPAPGAATVTKVKPGKPRLEPRGAYKVCGGVLAIAIVGWWVIAQLVSNSNHEAQAQDARLAQSAQAAQAAPVTPAAPAAQPCDPMSPPGFGGCAPAAAAHGSLHVPPPGADLSPPPIPVAAQAPVVQAPATPVQAPVPVQAMVPVAVPQVSPQVVLNDLRAQEEEYDARSRYDSEQANKLQEQVEAYPVFPEFTQLPYEQQARCNELRRAEQDYADDAIRQYKMEQALGYRAADLQARYPNLQ